MPEQEAATLTDPLVPAAARPLPARGRAGSTRRPGGGGLIRQELRHIFPDDWSFFFGEIALYCFIILVSPASTCACSSRPRPPRPSTSGSYQPLHGVARVRGLQLGPAPELRRARRPGHPPGAPLGRPRVRRGARLPPVPHVLHRRLSPPAAPQLAARPQPADARRHQRRVRLLAARRPAVGHRTAHRLLDHPVDAADRSATWPRCCSAATFPSDGPHRRASTPSTSCSCRRAIAGLLGAHLGLLWIQRHTQYPGRRRSDRTIVGTPLVPAYALRTTGFLLLVAGLLTAMRRLLPDQPGLALRTVPARGTRRASPSPTGTPAGSRARCA